MPSHIIHSIVGEQSLTKSGLDIADFSIEAFNMGCQGPDVFSHNRRTRPFALAYSRLLHRKNYGLFVANFARELVKINNSLVSSYFFGFISHQIVDRILHPYIVYKSTNLDTEPLKDSIVNPALYHAFLERILDVSVHNFVYKKPVASFNTFEPFFLDNEQIGRIAQILCKSLRKTYPKDALPDTRIFQRVQNAFKDALYFYELTNPVTTNMSTQKHTAEIKKFVDLGYRGLVLLFPESIDSSVDWLNLNKCEWLHPVSGEKNNASVIELVEKSIYQTIKIFFNLNEAILKKDFKSIQDIVGNDCLGVAGKDGKIGKVVYANSFDLDRAIKQEAQKRQAWLYEKKNKNSSS